MVKLWALSRWSLSPEISRTSWPSGFNPHTWSLLSHTSMITRSSRTRHPWASWSRVTRSLGSWWPEALPSSPTSVVVVVGYGIGSDRCVLDYDASLHGLTVELHCCCQGIGVGYRGLLEAGISWLGGRHVAVEQGLFSCLVLSLLDACPLQTRNNILRF